MPNHHPAPWSYENVEQRREDPYGVVKDANGKILFDSLNSDVAEIHTHHDGPYSVRWDESARVNLQLAAAAPALLANLEFAVWCIENPGMGPTPDALATMKAAIASAKAK
jgi:hypothetical protein